MLTKDQLTCLFRVCVESVLVLTSMYVCYSLDFTALYIFTVQSLCADGA